MRQASERLDDRTEELLYQGNKQRQSTNDLRCSTTSSQATLNVLSSVREYLQTKTVFPVRKIHSERIGAKCYFEWLLFSWPKLDSEPHILHHQSDPLSLINEQINGGRLAKEEDVDDGNVTSTAK